MNRSKLGLGSLGLRRLELIFDLLNCCILLFLLRVLVGVVHINLGQLVLELLQSFFVWFKVACVSRRLGPFVPPVHAFNRSQFDRVSDDPNVLDVNQGMAANQYHGGLGAGFNNRLTLRRLLLRVVAHNAARDQCVRGQGTRLVKQAVTEFSGQRHAEGLGAEDPDFHERHERSVDRHSHLHRQFARHDGREDDDTLEQQLVCSAVALLQPLHQHVRCRADGEAQQDEKAQGHLLGIRRHLIHGVLDHLQQLALAGIESRPQHVGQAASLWCLRDVGEAPAFRRILRIDDRGARKDDVDPVLNVDVERSVSVTGQLVLHLRHGFSSQ
mmetsp:Transcript_13491/g.32592  ORF Transcript_13491/g.32592 Transcript_13491/m.32592 type:complete len:327 (-) Transcript_13491:725-1705(-)